jgi:hypothetical protein
MRNYLKFPAWDDISELGEGLELDQEVLLPYKEEQVLLPVYNQTPHKTKLTTQLTEEEQIRIAEKN